MTSSSRATHKLGSHQGKSIWRPLWLLQPFNQSPSLLMLYQAYRNTKKISANVKSFASFQHEVGQEKRVKRDALIADHTGYTKVVLWEHNINSLTEGKSYNLKNIYVREYQSNKHLSMPKSGFEICLIHDLPNTITPSSNNDDEQFTAISQVQVIGVPQVDIYRSCLQCKARVEPCTPPLGKCKKGECQMMQLFDLCPKQISTRVLLRCINQNGNLTTSHVKHLGI